MTKKKAATNPLDAATERKKETWNVDVQMTPDEITDAGKKLARSVGVLHELEERKKEITATLSAEVKEQRALVRSLGRSVVRGLSEREVSVTVERNYETGRVIGTRDDTGEILLDRPLNESERQRSIPAG